MKIFKDLEVEGFDPHTYYFAPEDKDKFDISMSGKFEGIGARLQKKKGEVVITEIISGGPVWRDQQIEVGDVIMKVGQDDVDPVDISGMRLDDAIKLIKGPKGTIVNLTMKKVDGSVEIVKITRDLVETEETFAKSATVKKENHTYGVINLPKFYIDFKDASKRNAASDVAQEIERLKKQGMEGLVLDLRDNGGGSLQTVVEMAGLFIKDGPIVQVKSYGTKDKSIHSDKDERIQWDGPLVILVNELSASASEILAAAMQDYKRAVILGGNQTYGKGTVQNILPLNQYYPKYEKDLGYLKMTIQKFYRVNGGSTQKEGVYSDIAMPSRYSYMKVGERDLDGALAWDKVPQAKYSQTNSYSNFADVVYNSKQRIATDTNFKLVNEYAKWLKENQDDSSYSLNYKKFFKENKEKDLESKQFKSVFDYKSNLTYTSPKYEQSLFKDNKDLADKRMAWHKNLSKDMYVSEALNVLSELKLKDKSEIVKN